MSASPTFPDPATRTAITELAAAALAADKAAPYSEQTRLALDNALPDPAHLFVYDDADTVAGYAQVWPDGTTELAVHPAHRRRGHGGALLDRVRATAPAPRVWSYAGHPGADALAARAGLVRVRELWRMRTPLPVGPAGDPPGSVPLPDGVSVRTFDPARDSDAWLALNALAFGGHGEQGRLTRADLDARMATDWFDPNGFFLAERDGRLVGFHWTKEHPTGPDGAAAGEIYVLGVHPDEHGGGLGRSLTRIGLRHLADRGLSTALLYVDADNAPAVAVYRRMGFEVEASSVMFAHP
ncbi:MAG TPA: mycothiol synthase [Sporichthyaceae bacterium]